MERQHYSKRVRNYRHNLRHRKKNSEGGYFFIKANICLGIIICAVAAVSTENEKLRAGCEKLAYIIGTSQTESTNFFDIFKGGDEGIYTFADEKNQVILSDSIKAEIEARSNVYENNNKGAPQIGLSRLGEQ